MKHILTILLASLSLGGTALAQEISIDPYMFKEGYFDNLEDAKKEPEKVKYLSLSLQTPKLKEIPAVILTFTNLERLDVSFNQVVSIPDGIGALTKLSYLNAEGNHYMTKVSMEVTKMEALKELNILDARLPAADLEALKKAMPEGVDFKSGKR